LKQKLGKSNSIWANLIRFGQNQNPASPKTFDLLCNYDPVSHFVSDDDIGCPLEACTTYRKNEPLLNISKSLEKSFMGMLQ